MRKQDRKRRTVVITGASAGVGRAVAHEFARHGWNVGLIARGEAGLQGAIADVVRAGGRPLAFSADVADAEAVSQAADAIVEAFGGIDVWVNNAMVTIYAPVQQTSAEEFRRATEVTYLGQVHGTLAALKHMVPQDSGTIVHIGSAWRIARSRYRRPIARPRRRCAASSTPCAANSCTTAATCG